MKQNDRALLQERVRTLVLRHALEATLNRLIDLGGSEVGEDLVRLEHRIAAAGRNLGAMPSEMALSTMVAVEDAINTIRAAFDVAHRRLDAQPASAPVLAA